MNILEKIVHDKKTTLQTLKKEQPEARLRESVLFHRAVYSLQQNLLQQNSNGIIAEFKRRSPSKGWINEHADIAAVTQGYAAAGVKGISILTDQPYFGGTPADILSQRAGLQVPILRKDFIVDAYQVTEAKAIGADVILLIAACLSKAEVQELASYAQELGLEVLLELHDETELAHVCNEVDMIGINNRSLKTFEVDIDNAIQLLSSLPAHKLAIAESGINSATAYRTLKQAGFSGFLMGEYFMKETDPAQAAAAFIQAIQ
jgi:indole-3-glycerol phosphate synthase